MSVPTRDIISYIGGAAFSRYGRLVRPLGIAEPTISFTRAAAATFIDRDGKVRTAESGAIRTESLDSTGDGTRDMLVFLTEPARTNAWTRSEEFNHTDWIKTNALITADFAAAPDGLTTADRLIAIATDNEHYVTRTLGGTTDDTDSVMTIHAKADTEDYLWIFTQDKALTQARTWFNLANGTVGTQAPTHRVWMEALGNAWYRCGVTYDVGSGAGTPDFRFGVSRNDNDPTFLGDGVGGILLWGAQAEVDEGIHSSYVKTVASPVARPADVFTQPLTAQPGDCDYTLYLQLHRERSGLLTGPWDSGTSPVHLRLGTSTPSIFIWQLPTTATPTIRAKIATGVTDAEASKPASDYGSQPVAGVCAQFRNLATGGQVRIDTGSGFGAWSSAAAPISAWGGSEEITVREGQIYADLVLRGLHTFADCEAILP